MPSNKDPGQIIAGAGTSKSESLEGVPFEDTALESHITQPTGAHAASSISVDEEPEILSSTDVESAIDELSGLVPPLPPSLGNFRTFLGFSGIPDWGVLKLADSTLGDRFGTVWLGGEEDTFEYHWRAPDPTTGVPFSSEGGDPITDPTFNVADGTYSGGGGGIAHAGGFTRDPGTGDVMILSHRLCAYSTSARPVVVSGAVYPADKGVLALLRWPVGGDMVAFLAQPLTTRCIAALLLGPGLDSGCDPLATIFSPGLDGTGNYDPFAFPGRATGQYDLVELHTGVSNLTGNPLPAPYVANPSAGQVRLGSGTMPILGATTAAVIPGDDNNFFRYRLPYLKDYSNTSTGIRYTPTAERDRYFQKPAVSDTPGTDLTQAGDFQDFDHDYWSAQVARFRHRFLLDGTVTTPNPRESGTIILLHFKTEYAFEQLVSAGVVPADTDLYSANLVNWTDPESPTNIAADNPANNNPIAGSYHVLRGAILEDPLGDDAPVMSSPATFDYVRTVGHTVQISGVHYFYPADNVGTRFEFSAMDSFHQDLFLSSYRTAEPGVTGDMYLGNNNPTVYNMACFSYSEVGGSPTLAASAGVVVDVANGVRKQRVEFSLEDYGYNVAAPPPRVSNIETLSFGGADRVSFLGDLDYPSFSQDAKPWLYDRRPIGHDSVNTTALPRPSVPFNTIDSSQILFHSTRNDNPIYGNFSASGAPPYVALASLETALKDVEERFLDEVYRYLESWPGIPGADQQRLLGPGLPTGPLAIDVPVRAGTTVSYVTASWLQVGAHFIDLTLSTEAQVAGMPARAPRLNYRTHNPFPSRGMLMYPKRDYSVAPYRPSLGAGDLGAPQYDYSSSTGDRAYVRAFDVGFTRSSAPITPEGQSYFKIQVYGLRLADYAYSAPGPGSTAIAIMIKVPGLTTWMDLGRVDGSGPSKQDVFLDGAGCKVVGPDTYDFTDDELLSCSQVKVHVGPSATLFRNVTDNEVPILVKVIIKDTVTGKALDFTQTSFDASPTNNRALLGLEIVK